MADPVETDPGPNGSSPERRANELYWSSDRSVNSIADELNLSKGRLYEAVRPVRAGRTCPICGSELVFENRTARDQDEPACPMCDGTQMPLPPDAAGEVAGSAPHGGGKDGPSRSARVDTGDGDSGRVPSSDRSGVRSSSGPAPEPMGVVGGLFVGVAIGLVLGRFLRR